MNGSVAVRVGVPAGLVLAVLLAYAGALHAPFQFDDWWAIAGDTRAHSPEAWWRAQPGIRPLLKLVNALNWTLAATPPAFRALNIAIHAATALLAWALWRDWLPRLAKMDAASRSALPGITPDRTFQVIAGGIVLSEAMRAFGVKELDVSPWALREGRLLQMLDRV